MVFLASALLELQNPDIYLGAGRQVPKYFWIIHRFTLEFKILDSIQMLPSATQLQLPIPYL